MSKAYVVTTREPDLPPPVATGGALGWLRANLFASPVGALTTLLLIYVIWRIVAEAFDWAVVEAVWDARSADDCKATEGACWGFIASRFDQVVYGLYPAAERWRVDICYAVAFVGLAALIWPGTPRKGAIGVAMLTAFPVIAGVLLVGGVPGIPPVDTDKWGGLLLTLVIASTTIVLSIPLGLLLALARRSDLPALRMIATGLIEFMRGVPFIAVLFVASAIFPLFTPQGVDLDKLVRVLIAFSVFSSAFMAEVFRGGLQSIDKGQFEASNALGLGYWRTMAYVVLPQAVRRVIPALVNTCIAIFKETTLVLLVGLVDLLGVIQHGLSDPAWLGGGNIYASGYLFAAGGFWLFCFGMSRYSLRLERSGRAQASR